MCDSIARCLRPGGRFVTVNCNPALDFTTAPSYRRYGFETGVVGAWQEGAPITWTFFLEDGPFSIENYYLPIAAHEEALRNAGFRSVRWAWPAALARRRGAAWRDFWQPFLESPPITFIECTK
jgi:hypothetical protein